MQTSFADLSEFLHFVATSSEVTEVAFNGCNQRRGHAPVFYVNDEEIVLKSGAPNFTYTLPLLNAVKSNPNIKTLSLDNNDMLGDGFVHQITHMLKENTGLEKIDLRATGLTRAGRAELTTALEHMGRELEVLYPRAASIQTGTADRGGRG